MRNANRTAATSREKQRELDSTTLSREEAILLQLRQTMELFDRALVLMREVVEVSERIQMEMRLAASKNDKY